MSSRAEIQKGSHYPLTSVTTAGNLGVDISALRPPVGTDPVIDLSAPTPTRKGGRGRRPSAVASVATALSALFALNGGIALPKPQETSAYSTRGNIMNSLSRSDNNGQRTNRHDSLQQLQGQEVITDADVYTIGPTLTREVVVEPNQTLRDLSLQVYPITHMPDFWPDEGVLNVFDEINKEQNPQGVHEGQKYTILSEAFAKIVIDEWHTLKDHDQGVNLTKQSKHPHLAEFLKIFLTRPEGISDEEHQALKEAAAQKMHTYLDELYKSQTLSYTQDEEGIWQFIKH